MDNFSVEQLWSAVKTPSSLLILGDIFRYTSLFLTLAKYLNLPVTFLVNLAFRNIDAAHLQDSDMIMYLEKLNI
jgi:hypothetical protein